MKLFFLILFGIALPVMTAGQSSAPPIPPGIVISECGWEEYYSRVSRGNGPSITSADVSARQRRQMGSEGGRSVYPDATKRLPNAPDPFVIGPKQLDGRRWGYMYKMMVENNGVKKIKAIEWEYIFLDPLNQSVISRHPFLTKVKIKPGEKKKVSGLRVRQPTLVVRADAADLQDIEQVIIKRIEYSDGSAWVP